MKAQVITEDATEDTEDIVQDITNAGILHRIINTSNKLSVIIKGWNNKDLNIICTNSSYSNQWPVPSNQSPAIFFFDRQPTTGYW